MHHCPVVRTRLLPPLIVDVTGVIVSVPTPLLITYVYHQSGKLALGAGSVPAMETAFE